VKIGDMDINQTIDSLAHLKVPKKVIISSLWGAGLFVVSLIINYFAGTYATIRASNAVNDIILDNIPTVDVSFLFVYGIMAYFLIVIVLVLMAPHRAPFILKSLAIFIVIRAFFVSLTHLGAIPESAVFDAPKGVDYFTFVADYFFSAHTGLPFLMTLIFWPNKILRYVFLAISIIFAATVLLGHLHYSIDVFAAYFITYGIFVISTKFFKNDYQLLLSTLGR